MKLKSANKNYLLTAFANYIAFVLILLLNVGEVNSQSEYFSIKENFDEISLGNYAYTLEDKNGTLNIKDILKPEIQKKFGLSQSPEPGFGFTSSVYWLKIKVYNQLKKNQNCYLEISYPLIDYIDFYSVDDHGNYSVKRTGDHLPFETREIKNRNFIFSINIGSDQAQTYYLRFKTSSSMSLPVKLYSKEALLSKIEIEQLLLGIFFGAVIIMSVYNIFLFIGFRDRSFIYLFLFIISWGLAQFTINGLSYQYIWSGWTWWSDANLPFFIFASLVTAIQFCRSLLLTRKNSPLLDKLLNIERNLYLVLMVISLLLQYSTSIRIASGFAIVAILSVSITGLSLARQGNQSAIIFISAWGMFLVGAILFALKSFGILPGHFISNWGMQIGFFAMMVLLSVAVQDRIETEKKLKQKAQSQLIEALRQSERVLEQKAEERTNEINRINILLMDRAIELASINQLSEKVNSSLRLNDVLNFACEELVKIFSVRYSLISLADFERSKLQIVAFFSNDENVNNRAGEEIELIENGVFSKVLKSAQPAVLLDSEIQKLSSAKNSNIFGEDIHSTLIVPIISFKKVIGAIVLSVSENENKFSQYEIDLARTVSIQVASAIENAKQYLKTERALDVAERDLEIGRQIQSGFFPESLPQPPGLEISAHFNAARQVAGDFYDVFTVGDNNLTVFTIADVCDKGVGAALFMVLFRSLIRANGEQKITSENIESGLLSVITDTNNYISKTHSSSNMFASVFIGIADPTSSKIYYINAGHDAPVLINKNGIIIKRLNPTGPVIGMLPDMEFNVSLFHFNEGDILFAFTDGTTDAVNSDKDFFSEETLLQIIGTESSSGFSLLYNLNSELKKHIGSAEQFDDITQLVIRRKISGEPDLHSIRRYAIIENLGEILDFIETSSSYLQLHNDISFALKLSAEEVCTNIINYGFNEMNPGTIHISVGKSNGKAVLLISDDGRHFPPESAETPDINAELSARKTGGLGLYLIKELMDSISYHRSEDGWNILKLEKTLN